MPIPGKEKVRLYLYEHRPDINEIVVDSISAEDWGDFVLVSMKGNQDPEMHMSAMHSFNEAFPDKKVIIIAEGIEVSFYGVRESNDTPDDEPTDRIYRI